MAVYHVSGGGDALNTILRSSSTALSSIIYVHPGIYNPYNATRNAGISVIGVGETRDDVVIRGLYWDGSQQKFSSPLGSMTLLSHMTLSGFTRTNINVADIGYQTPCNALYDCNIFDCKTIVSSDPGIKGDLFHQAAFYNCHISGCTTGSYFFYGSIVRDCEINHNTMQYSSSAGTFFGGNDVRRNYVHDNVLRGYMQTNAQSYANIYENNNLNSHTYGNGFGIFANCLFIGNKNLNNFGYGCQYKNCVFAQNTTTGTAGNLYRPHLAGTSAQTQLRINNFYDVPLTSINNMQGLINNSQVSGKYVLAEDNHFDIQLADLGFVDSENHDYRLKSDSALISAGTMRSDFTVRYGSKYFPSSNQLDIDGRRFKNPPSVGPWQFYKSIEGEIPNYINPVGIPMYAVVPLSAYWGLCFVATRTNSTISMQKVGAPPSVLLEYSRNAKIWKEFVVGSTTIPLADVGDKVFIRAPLGTTNQSFSLTSDNNYNRFAITGQVKAHGNIMSLVNGFQQLLTIPSIACFSSLFRNNSTLIEPPQLPATTLKNQCYEYMFNGCSNLQAMPTLPASTVNARAYRQMFYNCTNLSSDILLPAATVQAQAYERMFQTNKKIKTADIRGTSVAYNALWSMFENSSLLSSVSVRFTTWQSSNNTWLGGVATTGVFTCPTALGTNETIERGTNRVPTGWTVVNI